MMKRLRFLLLTMLAIVTGYVTYGQSISEEARYKSGDQELNKFLNRKFMDEVKKHNVQVCFRSVTFAKFTIDTIGDIKGLTFSESVGSPPVFREILTAILTASSGAWVPSRTRGRAVESKPFVLPLIYEMEAGCQSRQISVKDGFSTSLINYLNFSDNSGVSRLECILLKPLWIGSQN